MESARPNHRPAAGRCDSSPSLKPNDDSCNPIRRCTQGKRLPAAFPFGGFPFCGRLWQSMAIYPAATHESRTSTCFYNCCFVALLSYQIGPHLSNPLHASGVICRKLRIRSPAPAVFGRFIRFHGHPSMKACRRRLFICADKYRKDAPGIRMKGKAGSAPGIPPRKFCRQGCGCCQMRRTLV